MLSTPIFIHALGTAELDSEGLDRGERRRIKAFVDERMSERDAQKARLDRMQTIERRCQEYSIHPDYVPPNENTTLWRFSCVGFVLRAYETARIQLLNRDSLPMISLEKLKAAYPSWAGLLSKAEVRERLGIGQGREWPIVLAGYVLHSLAREAAEIRNAPYVVDAGDEHFP